MLERLMRSIEHEQAEQQEWISQEIHDGACQYAFAAQMVFHTFRREQAGAFSGDWSGFDMAVGFLNHASEELRRLVRGLRPIQLAAGDLPKAIDCLVKEIRAAGGPDIEVCCDIQPDEIPQHLELAAFRIVHL